MKLKLYPELLIRVPQFPLNANLQTEWEKLKESIRLSSKDFYEQIKNVPAEDLDKLPRHIYHSIWKYFNRAKYRSTPYGSFAGIGYVKATNSDSTSDVTIEKYQKLHPYPCWSEIENAAVSELKIDSSTILHANSTYYKIGSQIRFLINEGDVFQLAEVPCTIEIINILEGSHKSITVGSLLNRINDCNLELIQELVDQQLLITEHMPNIIGEDYFKRTSKKINDDSSFYILAERKIVDSNLTQRNFENVPELIALLQRIVPEPSFDELTDFKLAFRKKFEDRTVPLMIALDPEIGVGYGQLDTPVDIPVPIEQEKDRGINRNKALDTIIFKSLLAQGGNIVDLEMFVANDENQQLPLPNSIGVLCFVADELLIVEQICTPTSNRINGRFTLAGNKINEMCRKIAKEEQSANPDVIFFDIGYTNEADVDNINRRKEIYPFQVSLLNYNSSEQPMNLNDIDITLNGDEIILYNRRQKKRVVPRLSSGYNYKRSTLSVFRFLCDLQYNGIKSNLDLRLPNYFQGQDYYPRVQYKNIILSPAQWRIHCDTLYKDYCPSPGIFELGKYARAIGLVRYGIIRTEDRTMCFDLEDTSDMVELLHLLNKFGSLLLEEGFIPKMPIVKDVEKNGYNHQFVLTVLNKCCVYDSLIRDIKMVPPATETRRFFLPGCEWLYFEIYTHPLRVDQLLIEKINAFLDRNRTKIKSWFFIRYDENGEHLRLRIKLEDPLAQHSLVQDLNTVINSDIEEGIVSDLKICTYKREIERYGPDLIMQVEEHFCKDSEYVIAVMQSSLSTDDRYRMSIDLLLCMRSATANLEDNFDRFIDRMCRGFAKEHQISGIGFRNLNNHFKTLPKLHKGINKKFIQCYEECKVSAVSLLKLCPIEKQIKLAADLFHMHVNRLFPAHQRSHEMIIYYFAQKDLLRTMAFSKVLKEEKIRA